jgi:DNA-binding LacI/PurR family transcriptional regulator
VKNSVTLKAIANQVGVSIAAISHTLNDQPGGNPYLRDQICQIACESGNTPFRAARGYSILRTAVGDSTLSHPQSFTVIDKSLPDGLIQAGLQITIWNAGAVILRRGQRLA